MAKTLRIESICLDTLLGHINTLSQGGRRLLSMLRGELFDDWAIFWITEQSHQGSAFGGPAPAPNIFNAPCGVQLRSEGGPEWRVFSDIKILYVRGRNREVDDEKILCRLNELELIERAIDEYNIHYGAL